MSLNRITPTARLLARTFQNAPQTTASRLFAPSPFAMATRSAATTAKANTVKLTSAENLKMLNEQRSVRPSSPHFTIYQPQLTWIGSIFNRVTGVGLSVGEWTCASSHKALRSSQLTVWLFLIDFLARLVRILGRLPRCSSGWTWGPPHLRHACVSCSLSSILGQDCAQGSSRFGIQLSHVQRNPTFGLGQA